jgi:hypothetical protein
MYERVLSDVPILEAITSAHDEHNTNRDAEWPAHSTLHPRVYTILVALAAWFALAVWSFAGRGLVDYLLVIVCGFIFVVVALQLILSRVGRADDVAEQGDPPSLRNWATRDFETWQGKLSGAQAAVQILLPIAAAAIGMTAFGIVFIIAGHGSL